MHNRGLTLIELLVVVVIIAVLAAFLMAVYSSGKAASRRAGCVTQMQQIGVALAAYADDYNGVLPDCVKMNPFSQDDPAYYDHDWPKKLHVMLQPRCKSRELFRCPADAFRCLPYPKPRTRREYFTVFEAFGSSYQNYAEIDCYQKDNSPVLSRMQSDLYGMKWPVRLARIPMPGKTRLVRDAIPFHTRSGRGKHWWHWNELFADWHVETIKSAESRGGDPTWGFSYDTGGIL